MIKSYCLDIQALCSKASSAIPIFPLKKSICLRNCAIPSSGALCWKESLQICKRKLPFVFVCINALHPSHQIFSHVGMFSVFLRWISTKQRIKCLAQWRNTVPQLSLELWDLKSNILPTEPLRSSLSFVRGCIGLGTRPWTNRFTSASTTIVSSSSQSHMVDPDWIQIFNRKRNAMPTSL